MRSVLSFVRNAVVAMVIAGTSVPLAAVECNHESARPVEVSDSIAMNWIGSQHDEFDPATLAPLMSRSRKQFVIITRHGSLSKNTNDYSLLLFSKSHDTWSRTPRSLAVFSSSSNRPGIANVKWSADDRTVLFLGAKGEDTQQVFAVDTRTAAVRQLTSHRTDVLNFDVTRKLDTVAFEAEPIAPEAFDRDSAMTGIRIDEAPLELLLGGGRSGSVARGGPELFIQRRGERPWKVAVPEGVNLGSDTLAVSPDGSQVAVIMGLFETLYPPNWRAYSPSFVGWGTIPTFGIVDVRSGAMRSLLNAPAALGPAGRAIKWSSDSNAVIVDTYLPLATEDANERESRRKGPFVAEIDVSSGQFRKIESGNCRIVDWDADAGTLVLATDSTPLSILTTGCGHGAQTFRSVDGVWTPMRSSEAPEVFVEQGMNLPPRVLASEGPGLTKTVVFDPNPQFCNLQLTQVREIRFSGTDGSEWTAGLYRPIAFKPGHKYPLVIQTHGWDPQRFEIDGESTAGYAAQELAGLGFVVVQVPDVMRGNTTTQEGPISTAQYEGIIDELDRAGMIDRAKVALQAWSRTGYGVRYALAFSKYRIAAAVIVDGMEAGYVQYMLDSDFSVGTNLTFEGLNGGIPFGQGLKQWFDRSPMFHLDKVQTPILQFMLGPYSYRNMWESYTALRRLKKPVEMILLPESNHWPLRPSERLAVQQRVVDWFRFWLKSEEDPVAGKEVQYKGWRVLRALYEAKETGGAVTTGEATQQPVRTGASMF